MWVDVLMTSIYIWKRTRSINLTTVPSVKKWHYVYYTVLFYWLENCSLKSRIALESLEYFLAGVTFL